MIGRYQCFRAHRLAIAVLVAGTYTFAGTLAGAQTAGLVSAAERGDVVAVQALLDSAPDATAQNHRASALYAASSKGHLEVVRLLLAANVDADSGAESGRTPLFMASQNGHLDVVRALLAANADPNPTLTVGGRTALMAAISQGHLQVARALMEAGADANTAATNGETPLMLAAGRRSPEALPLVQSILAAGVDVDAGRPPPREESRGIAVRTVVPVSADPQAGNLSMRSAVGTPLGRASSAGNAEIVRVLLAAKAQVDARQPGWGTPLIGAAASGYADVIRVLMSAGADVNATDNGGNTALMRASANKRSEAVKTLLAAKADVNARRRDGGTALMLAMQLDQAEAARFQRRKVVAALSPGNTSRASSPERTEVVRALLSAGADVSVEESSGTTALMLASTNGHLDVVQMLLAAKADVNVRRRDGNTALTLAMQNDQTEVEDVLKAAVAAGPAER